MSDTELESLKERAKKMNISFHPNISVDKLREKVNGALDTPVEPAKELTKQEQRMLIKKEQTALVRIQVTNMNPAKKEHQGVLITASNSVIGTERKYVPFGVAWHVPRIIYNVMKEKQHTVDYVEKVNGNPVNRTRRTNTYAIEVLPPLTKKELEDLAKNQAMAAGKEV